MEIFGEWGPLLRLLGVLLGFAMVAFKATQLWKARKAKQLLARRRKPRPPDD